MAFCIHQIWIQGETHFKETQPAFYEFSKRWKEHYPECGYKLWSEEDILPVLEAHSDALVRAYELAPSKSAQSDIARYALLHSNTTGYDAGLYADTDYESFKRCDYFFQDTNITTVLVAMNLSKNKLLFGNYRYSTAWLYARQQSPVLKYMLAWIAQRPYDETKYTKFQYAWEITGPKGLGTIVQQYNIENNPSVRIVPHSMIEVADFSNLAVTYKTKEEILADYPFAVGVHRCDGSWIKDAKGLKATFGRFYAWVNSWSDFVSIGLLVAPIFILILVFILWKVFRRRHIS